MPDTQRPPGSSANGVGSPAATARARRAETRTLSVLLLVTGALGTWYNHHVIATEREFLPWIAIIAPVAAVYGLFYQLYPDEDPTAKAGPGDWQLRHRVALVLALAAGLGHWYLMQHGWAW